MYCGKSKVLIGARVKIVKNICNECEPFLNLTGVACNPFKYGSTKPNWIGVILDEDTIYGKKFNFHIEELEIYEI